MTTGKTVISNRRFWIGIILIATAAAGLGMLGMMKAGAWLVVEDPLQPAPVVVIFGGKVPFRAMEAARIYKLGASREVWVTRGAILPDDAAMVELGIDRMPEDAYSRLVLE